nr:C-type lectin [Glycymeris yessoensis]
MKFTALIVVMAGLQCCIVVASGECEAGWRLHGDSCYLFNQTKMTQAAAEEYCTTQNGHLAQPTSEGINTFLKTTASQLENGTIEHYWIDGTDSAVEGQFRWLDGKCFSYVDWMSAEEPNDRFGEDCIHLRASLNYKWNDISCSKLPFFFICEKPTETCTTQ